MLLDGKINIVIKVRKNTSNAHLGLNIKITEEHSYKIITMNVKRELFFIIACDIGWYGSNCMETCGRCLEVENCSITNGSCFGGCMEGYTGDACHGKVWYSKQT